MDKLPVGQLPDLTQSNNDDEIMVITNSEYNQLKKEKISDLITDFTSTNENNALTKGTDGKMFVTDFGNASNITEGTLPTSVLPEIPLEKIPDIPKDKLPPIETADLPVSGVSADTYAYPSSVTVNAQGQVTAIEEGTPSGSNANTDLSNITEAGKEVIRQTATEALAQKVDPNQVMGYAAPDFDNAIYDVFGAAGTVIPARDINTNSGTFLEYIPPDDGWLMFQGQNNGVWPVPALLELYVVTQGDGGLGAERGLALSSAKLTTTSDSYYFGAIIPVAKGRKYRLAIEQGPEVNLTGLVIDSGFFYSKGQGV